MSPAAATSVVITHPVGLHARPSVKFTKLAKSFAATIEIATTEEGPWMDAKSLVKVMAAKARQHATLHLRAHGPDAAEAVSKLAALVARDFDEVGHAAVG
jgi:phosphocarrier protein